jgi:hypothetical protein
MRLLLGASVICLSACGSVNSSADGPPADAAGDACSPETDSAFCLRLGKTCESFSGTDNCGHSRTANCGTCSGSNVCVMNSCLAPVCPSFTFSSTSTPVSGVNASGVQDAVQGLTPSGSTMLFQRGRTACSPYSLFIADETSSGSGAYQAMDISAVSTLAPMDIAAEQTLTLTADGKTIIGTTTDRKHFLASTRSGPGLADFGVATGADFVALAATGSQTLGSPYISGDGLAFYYVISGDTDATKNGIYESLRASAGMPFPAGTRMPDLVQQYSYVTATSSDRMALFVQNSSFTMFVLTRRSLSQPFSNPNAPSPPPMLPGWRTRPLTNCQKIIGTCNSGCVNEDTCAWPRM